MPDINAPDGDNLAQAPQTVPSHVKSASMSTANTALNPGLEQDDAGEKDMFNGAKNPDDDAAPAVQSPVAATGRRQSNLDTATAKHVDEVLNSEVLLLLYMYTAGLAKSLFSM
jgi:hypothetical protein